MKYVRGPVIKDVTMDEDEITFRFEGGSLRLRDCGQSCCETRYMSTDDDIRSLIGQRFVCWEVKDGGTNIDDDGYDQHDAQFLEIQTEGGFVTIVNHNEHNGYYGGFSVREEWRDQFGKDEDDD
jgi:hypothetical protein